MLFGLVLVLLNVWLLRLNISVENIVGQYLALMCIIVFSFTGGIKLTQGRIFF